MHGPGLSAVLFSITLAVLATSPPKIAAASDDQYQQAAQSDPSSVVDRFLKAREAHDHWGAASQCADLLELQDVDGSWFVDVPTMSDWLRQLTDLYRIEVIRTPQADRNTVVWTERLVPRISGFEDSNRSSVTLDVYAVVRDGKIAYLSGPYPPIPLRRGIPVRPDESHGPPMTGPGTLLACSAIGLSLTGFLAVSIGRVASRASRGCSGLRSRQSTDQTWSTSDLRQLRPLLVALAVSRRSRRSGRSSRRAGWEGCDARDSPEGSATTCRSCRWPWRTA
jgi:hypothetical protein